MNANELFQKAEKDGFEYVYLTSDRLIFLKGESKSLRDMGAYAGGVLGCDFAKDVVREAVFKNRPVEWRDTTTLTPSQARERPTS